MVKNVLILLLVIIMMSCADQKNDNQQAATEPVIDLQKQADSLKSLGYNVFTYQEQGKEYLMQEYYMVQLLTGNNDSLPDKRIEELQALHMKHLSSMYEQGHASLIGPMNNGGNWRGIVVYNTPTLQMADSLAHLDPYVKSGVMKVKTTGWWTEKGGRLR